MEAPLSALLETFESDPFGRARVLRQLFEADPDRFTSAIVDQLAGSPDGPGTRFLLAFLDGRKQLVPALVKLGRVNREAMARTARELQRCDTSFDLRLALQLVDDSNDREKVAHPDFFARLELLGCVISGAKLAPLMLKLLRLPDRKLTSKAALLLGRVMQSPEWFAQHLNDPNPRMRANLVEALWEVRHFETRGVFDLAVKDPDQRVAANAWLGLFLRGEARALVGLERMARRPETTLRASAAWAIAQTGDPRFTPLLETLRRDTAPHVRRHAEAGLARNATLAAPVEANHSLLQFSSQRTPNGGWQVDLTLDVPATASHNPPLAPVHYQVWSGANPQLDYEVRQVVPEGPSRVGWLIPYMLEDEAIFRALHDGLTKGMRCLRRTDGWAVVGYDAEAVPASWQSWNGTILHAQGSSTAADFSPSQGQEWMPLAEEARNFEKILRSMRGFARQPDAPWGMRLALAGLAGANARRHLCWVLPGKLLLDADEVASLQRRVELCRAAIHVFCLPGVPPATVEAVQSLTAPTGGAWTNLGSADELAERVQAFGLSNDCVHRITLPAGSLAPGSELEISLRHPEIIAAAKLRLPA